MDPIEKLLNRHARVWSFLRTRRDVRTSPRRPMVTVSGQHGTRRSAIARRVAERLGLALWDHEILCEVAKGAGAPERLYEALDEHPRRVWRDLVASFQPASGPDTYEYSHRLFEILRAVICRGGAVVVGRGAQFLARPSEALRVRLVGALEDRVRNRMRDTDCYVLDARREIDRVDAERRAFIREQYDRDIDDRLAYDLVLNVARLRVDVAAEVIAQAYEARFGLPHPEASQRTLALYVPHPRSPGS